MPAYLAVRPWRGEWPSSADRDVKDHSEANRVEAGIRDPRFGSRGRPLGPMGERGEGAVERGVEEQTMLAVIVRSGAGWSGERGSPSKSIPCNRTAVSSDLARATASRTR